MLELEGARGENHVNVLSAPKPPNKVKHNIQPARAQVQIAGNRVELIIELEARRQ